MDIRTEKLRKVYKVGEDEIVANNDLDLVINDGEFVAIMGTSGCGKTTLLHLLGGLDNPTSGNVFVGGNDLSKMKDSDLSSFRCKELGFIFQKFNLLNELTVKENIIMPILISKNEVDEAYIDELCKYLKIDDRLDHTPLQISGGQQQRVAIARALANNPGVILCDEPTGNLDKKNSEDVVELLQNIHSKYKKTIVMVTHDSNVASKADRIIRMEDGRIID